MGEVARDLAVVLDGLAPAGLCSRAQAATLMDGLAKEGRARTDSSLSTNAPECAPADCACISISSTSYCTSSSLLASVIVSCSISSKCICSSRRRAVGARTRAPECAPGMRTGVLCPKGDAAWIAVDGTLWFHCPKLRQNDFNETANGPILKVRLWMGSSKVCQS